MVPAPIVYFYFIPPFEISNSLDSQAFSNDNDGHFRAAWFLAERHVDITDPVR